MTGKHIMPGSILFLTNFQTIVPGIAPATYRSPNILISTKDRVTNYCLKFSHALTIRYSKCSKNNDLKCPFDNY
jgi:hypothetical protein